MNEVENNASMAEIGQNLMQHAKTSDLDGRRGLVVDLFPFIFGAAERMSARAISRFLKEKHGVKLSAVTITKALNDPKKNWNLFFDTIAGSVETFEKWNKTKREEFLFNDEIFKEIHFPGREVLRKHLLKYEFAQAINVLRKKWVSIDYETRLKGRPYLAERILGKAK